MANQKLLIITKLRFTMLYKTNNYDFQNNRIKKNMMGEGFLKQFLWVMRKILNQTVITRQI